MKNNMIKIIKSVLVFLMFVVVFAAGFLLLNFFKNDGAGGEIFDISNDRGFMFLLAGVDSTGEDTGTRTDTLMLVNVNKDKNTIDMISIPRDSYVSIRGSMDKINAAHSYGGIDLTMEVVRDFLGINLDKYFVISFDAVIAGINALGGMDVEVSNEVASAMGISPGIRKMAGDEVLAYVRFRKGYQNADLGRINTQQDFMKQFIKEATKAENISKLPSVYKAMKPYIKTNIGLKNLSSLALEFKSVDPSNINSIRLEGEPFNAGGISYFKVYPNSIEEIRQNYLKSYLRN
ncbi:LCP family protein [Anaerococcus sp. NML200574]|uniref:LCP family protein n=1 Tax=unclassified Anaerococcus TaxID=2614126 RepID=UPI002237CC52|nr:MULTISPECIES: LCP family protein [unclassified Anaerococcus]MCW6677942.1 LCP family protein [Anaerococcus sp. NML200574]MCW6700683.1 LCP family protein [Anaerococcus sp. NML200537]